MRQFLLIWLKERTVQCWNEREADFWESEELNILSFYRKSVHLLWNSDISETIFTRLFITVSQKCRSTQKWKASFRRLCFRFYSISGFRGQYHRLFIPYVGIFCFMLLWLTATQNIWQVPYCPWNFILLVDTFVQIQTRFWIIALIDLITVLEAAISTTRQRLIRNDSVCKRIPIPDHSLNNWIQKNLWIARLKY